MTIPEIFNELINSPELKISLKVYNQKDINDIKKGLSNYKLRNKAKYEGILGPFRLRYNILNGPEQDIRLEVTVEGNDTAKDYEGVEIYG